MHTTTRRMHRNRMVGAAAIAVLLSTGGCGDDPDTVATVAFESPTDGQTTSGGTAVVMTADGLTIEEAGEVHAGAGHFHIVADAGCVAPGETIAKDADHVHFGGGQTDGTIYLAPGPHELCLQVGDGTHVALEPTDVVDIEIGVTTRDQWCAVITEVDALFANGDINSDDFSTVAAAAENLHRLFEQLRDGLDQVDDDAREAVATEVGYGLDFTAAFADATDFSEVQATLAALPDGSGGESAAGRAWILDTCSVDIAG